MEYTVELRDASNDEVIFTWTGYADNIGDALDRAALAHEYREETQPRTIAWE